MVAYGSKASPVAQDPFQQIVEVHWGPRYLAVRIDVNIGVEAGAPLDNSSIIGPALVEPFTFRYAASIDPAGAPSLAAAHVGNSGHWSTVPSGDVEASGLPSLSSVDLGLWQWTVDDGAGIKGPFDQWVASAGIDGPYIEGPGGITFDEGLEPSVALKGQKFLPGAPEWTPYFSNVGQWGTGETDGSPFVPLISEISSQAFSMDGLSVTYKGKTWRPIASKVSNAVGNSEGSLMVLLKREEVSP
ncbi:MAG: hypothetical protein EOS27_27100 [Mesorhizobium sp.]|nr:MAG: hypothetical protein EOS27_27100 [Mesorhizobium sp.]